MKLISLSLYFYSTPPFFGFSPLTRFLWLGPFYCYLLRHTINEWNCAKSAFSDPFHRWWKTAKRIVSKHFEVFSFSCLFFFFQNRPTIQKKLYYDCFISFYFLSFPFLSDMTIIAFPPFPNILAIKNIVC